MTHEAGIEAAWKASSPLLGSGYGSQSEVFDEMLKAYLSASGMVLVRPGEPKMENAAWEIMKAYYGRKASKDISDEILRVGIWAAPDPFKSKP